MKKSLTIAILVLMALGLCGGAAAAQSEFGLWMGGQVYDLTLPDETTGDISLQTFFVGGYAAGRYEQDDLGFGYKFVYAMSDSVSADLGSGPVPDSGKYFLLGASGDFRFGLGQGFGVKLFAGADYWWGEDNFAVPDFFSFFQARVGAGIVKRIDIANVSFTAEAGSYFVLDTMTDEYDFEYDHTLFGYGFEAGVTMDVALNQGMAVQAGLKCAFASEIGGPLEPASGNFGTKLEGFLGVAWN